MAPKKPMTGWELVYRAMMDSLEQKSDVLILLVHWALVFKKDFQCLGIGTEKELKNNEDDSAVLPEGWNDGDVYNLRYACENSLYLLTGANFKEIFILNLLNIETEELSSTYVYLDEIVLNTRGPIEKLFKNHLELINTIQVELIDPVFTTNMKRKKDNESHFSNPIKTINPAETFKPFSNPFLRRQPSIPLMIGGRYDLNPLRHGEPRARVPHFGYEEEFSWF